MGKKKAAAKPAVTYSAQVESNTDGGRDLIVVVEATGRSSAGPAFYAESGHVHLTPEQYVSFHESKAYERLCRQARQRLSKALLRAINRGLAASEVLHSLEPKP